MKRGVRSGEIVGKKIVGYNERKFEDGRGGYACDPVFILSDGSMLTFMVVETESLQYGISIIRTAPKKENTK